MGFVMLRRLAQAALILLGVAAITFVLLYALPADPARMIAGRSATAQTVANIRHELASTSRCWSSSAPISAICCMAISAAPMRRKPTSGR